MIMKKGVMVIISIIVCVFILFILIQLPARKEYEELIMAETLGVILPGTKSKEIYHSEGMAYILLSSELVYNT